MTLVTPPGWYPDPGQKQDGPPTERWWDGTAWTARIRRTAPAAAPARPEGDAGSDEGAASGRSETVPGQRPGDDAPAGRADAGPAGAGSAGAGHTRAAEPADTEPADAGHTRAAEPAGAESAGAGHAPADDALAGQTDAADTASEPGDTAQSLAGRDVAGRTGTEQTATGQEGPSPTGTAAGTAAGGEADGRAAGAEGAATGQPVPGQAGAGHTGAGQADAGPHGSVRATEGEAAARHADAAPAAEGPVGAERTDAARAAAGQAAAEPTTAGQADAARAAGQQADTGGAAEGQVGAGPTAAHQAAGRTAPVQAAGGWVSDGQAAPGAVPAYGSGVGQGGGWGSVETLGGGIPGYPVHPVAPPSRRGRRLRIGIAVAVAVAVLASIGVGVYALTDDGGGRSTATSQQPGGRDDGRDAPEEGGPDREGEGGGDEPRRVESGAVTDSLSGISLPVPDGWYGEELQAGAALTSKTSYDCPGDTSKTCVKGGAYSAPAVVLGTRGDTAEEVAKADIAANAEESYGGEAYGRITSHDVLASKAVTVAGQKGYLVRWKAVTQEGSDGFVQSLAFPSPSRPDQIVVVRFGVDTDQQQKILDEITEGIEVAEGGRGNGQDV